MIKKIYLYFRQKVESCNRARWYHIFLFWGLGISSTVWFLVRVVPKPSRATYPCMQAAAPMMSAFVVYLLSFTGAWFSYRKMKQALRARHYLYTTLFFFLLIFFGGMMAIENSGEMLAQIVLPVSEPKMAWGKNNPVGTAKGIYPGRVVWSHAPGAATWEKGTGFWYEDHYTNQSDADWLVVQSLLSLTGEKSEKKAWNALFAYFNREHGKGGKVRDIGKGKRLQLKSIRTIRFHMMTPKN